MAFACFLVQINQGIGQGLGVFFHPWSQRLGVTESSLIWVQTMFLAMNLLAGPIVVGLARKFSPQIVGLVIGIINCASFVVAAQVGTVEIRYNGLEGTGGFRLLNPNVVKSNHQFLSI